jgi:DNA replication protein DnaC
MKDFKSITQIMKEHGMKLPECRVMISISNARENLRICLNYFLGGNAQWLPEYEDIAKWFESNDGRGLFLYGDCGRGKSILGQFVIPAMLLTHCNLVMTVFDSSSINSQIDTAIKKRIISLDDVGVEDVSVKYGERRMAFPEIMDSVEKQGKLIIISTNLNQTELRAKYGDRVMDRIISTTTRVKFEGKSLRN